MACRSRLTSASKAVRPSRNCDILELPLAQIELVWPIICEKSSRMATRMTMETIISTSVNALT